MGRLIITHMVLENFKSYAGVQRVGPFHKCFSSVVGPNGSGKSNVIDAMLFVFGKKAKQLRLNKVSELIHNSADHQNLESARVEVHFQEIVDGEGDAYDLVPGTALVVARTAHASNASNYYLNDRKSNFTEVTTLLKAKGIDLDNNRFLILQGEVEQIAMMKPKGATPGDEGLLEYLEDIVGSDAYIPAIDAAAAELEATAEKRSAAVHRAAHAERERAGLEGAKAEAEAYLAKEGEMLTWKGIQCQLHVAACAASAAAGTAEAGRLRQRLEDERAALVGHVTAAAVAESALQSAAADHAAVTARIAAATEAFAACERQDVRLREDLKALKAKLKKAEDKASRDATKGAEATKEAERLAAAAPQHDATAAADAAALVAAEAEAEALATACRAELESARIALDTARAALAPHEQAVSAAAARVAEATAESALVAAARGDAASRLAAAQTAQAEAAAVAASAESEATRLSSALAAHRKRHVAVVAESTRASAAATEATTSLRTLRSRAAERAATAVGEQSRSVLVTALAAAAASGVLRGVHGRLGDLGAVPAKYGGAASSACAALDYVVVDDAAAADAAVKHLRSKGLGVATFLLLDTQRAKLGAAAAAPPPQTPENVPRLFDLVAVSHPDIKAAFYFALRDTLVATDLEQASRIAYGADARWRRVVTLAGEVIEPSGTMAGGGGKPKAGRIAVGAKPPVGAWGGGGAGDAAAAAAEAASAMVAGEAAAAMATAAAEAATAAVVSLDATIAAIELDVAKATLAAESARGRAADAVAQLPALTKAAKAAAADNTTAARMAALQAESETAAKALSVAEADGAGAWAAVATASTAMDAVGGPGLVAAKARCAALRDSIAVAGAAAAKARAQAGVAAKTATKLAAAAAEAATEAETTAAAVVTTKTAFAAVEDAALAADAAKAAAEGDLTAAASAHALARAAHDAAAAGARTVRSVEVELVAKLEDTDKGVADAQAKAKHWAKQVETNRRERAAAIAATRAAAAEIAAASAPILAAAAGDGDVVTDTTAAPATAAAAGGDDDDLPPLLTADELAKHNAENVQYQLVVVETAMAEMKPDLGAVRAYAAKATELAKRRGELDAATAARDGARAAHDGLRKRRLDDFMAGFTVIALRLKEMYQLITLGGDAELELVDSLDPFAEGVVFSVRPPKKSWKNISNLSGGEKTLSSLALVFALHHYKPTPLYVMDEIDAALDFKNVSIVANYIKERTKDAQFVIISLRNNMFELADRLVGIYKTDNATKSVTISPAAFCVGPPAAAEQGGAPLQEMQAIPA